MTVNITLTIAGTDTGPFNLYSNTDTYGVPFAIGISRSILETGYTSTMVPDGTTIVKVLSTGECTTDTYANIVLLPVTTSTTTSLTPPNVININDIVLSFSDEASPGYVNGGAAGTEWGPDIDYWIANMSSFDPNKFLTFDIGASFGDLYPTIGVVPPYDAPPNGVSNVINIVRPVAGDSVTQAAFAASIKTTLETKYGVSIWNDLVTQSRRIIMFIDVSGSMNRNTIGLGIDEFELFLTTNGITWTELQCSNERWVKWLVNSALNVSDCL